MVGGVPVSLFVVWIWATIAGVAGKIDGNATLSQVVEIKSIGETRSRVLEHYDTTAIRQPVIARLDGDVCRRVLQMCAVVGIWLGLNDLEAGRRDVADSQSHRVAAIGCRKNRDHWTGTERADECHRRPGRGDKGVLNDHLVHFDFEGGSGTQQKHTQQHVRCTCAAPPGCLVITLVHASQTSSSGGKVPKRGIVSGKAAHKTGRTGPNL